MSTDTMTKRPTGPRPATAAGRGAGRRPRRAVHPTARGIWPFVVPAAVVTALLVLLPIAYTVWLSVTDRQSDGTNAGFLGFDNYARMFADPAFYNSLTVTLFLFVVCLAVETVLGLALGYVMSLDVPGRRVFQGMMLIPAITASVAVGLLWLLIMDPSLGVANELLAVIGIDPVVWLGDPSIAPWSIALVDIWQWTPFMALIISAGIRSLPEEPFEAAAIDGASGWRTAWNIGLPLLRPVLTVAMLLRTVDLVRFFDTIYIMTQGGPVDSTNTLNVYGYNEAFIDQEPSYAATLQIALLVLVVLIAAVFTLVRRRAAK